MTGLGVFIVVGYSVLLVGIVALLSLAIPTRRWKLIIAAPALTGVAWLAYAPFAEERDIQARFAELCKDAGVKIARKVEVEGFYDDTRPNSVGTGRFSPQAVAVFDREGYQFYEYRFIGTSSAGKQMLNPEGHVAHYEKQHGEWTATLLKEPRARYQFKRSRDEERMGPKIWATEYVVIDSQSGETIAREVQYVSLPNRIDLWWASMLGNPIRSCPENRPKRLPDDVFIPLRKGQ
jgi:hypothetical protein